MNGKTHRFPYYYKRRRYVRSVDLARDVHDPDALDGYVITPSVREAAGADPRRIVLANPGSAHFELLDRTAPESPLLVCF